ncbi:MAG: SRPBCC domain-containing protein [Rhodospirillales bacterium]|nr:SRPBCC domain-containing protein [Rhodospirillales bacterium]
MARSAASIPAATSATESGRTLSLTRRFDAPRETVFRAFTDAKMLRQWWGPKGFTCPRADIDMRPGGAYRIEMCAPSGEIKILAGVYREVSPPARLVYTWVWQQGDMAGVETLVTLDFVAHGRATELRVTHELLPSDRARELHGEGWSSGLDRLVAMLSAAA